MTAEYFIEGTKMNTSRILSQRLQKLAIELLDIGGQDADQIVAAGALIFDIATELKAEHEITCNDFHRITVANRAFNEAVGKVRLDPWDEDYDDEEIEELLRPTKDEERKSEGKCEKTQVDDGCSNCLVSHEPS